jgi:hypothetical protein
MDIDILPGREEYWNIIRQQLRMIHLHKLEKGGHNDLEGTGQ